MSWRLGGTGRWSLGVKDGKIAFVGLENQAAQAARVIDATGKLVVPGGIEPHLGDRITMQPGEANAVLQSLEQLDGGKG